MIHQTRYFILAIVCIVVLGSFLRLNRYDSIPSFDMVYDEVMYPWAGMSLIQTGVPTSWSGVSSYKEKTRITTDWGKSYILVTPWVHKPLLYPLLTGGLMILSGTNELEQLRFSKLRLIPIVLNVFTIVLVAISATQLFNRSVGLVAALLYATIPTVVISGRLSLIENALTPVLMLVLILSTKIPKSINEKWHPYLFGFLCAIAIHLKQVGIFLSLACVLHYVGHRRFKEGLIVTFISVIAVALFFGIGSYYAGVEEFLRLNFSLSDYHAAGLPQLVSVLFRNPMITFKSQLFVDPFILAGYILLFSSPFWLPQLDQKFQKTNYSMLLMLPLLYLLVLQLVESGGSRVFGWHFFPLFPFVCILLAVIWYQMYIEATLQQLLSAILIMIPTFIWISKLFPTLFNYWQILVIIMFLNVCLMSINSKFRRVGLISSLLLLVIVNGLAICSIPEIFIEQRQPSLSN